MSTELRAETKSEIYRKLTRGSFTVEAAFVMPIVFLAVMGALYLCFFVHNRSWLTAAGYEAALCGSMEAVRENGKVYETAKMQSEQLADTGFFGGNHLQVQQTSGERVRVVYQMDTFFGFGGFSRKLQAGGSVKIIRPVSWIRKIKAASEILMGDGESYENGL